MRDKNFLISNGIDVDKSLELFGDMQMYDETLDEFLNGVQKKVNDLKTSKEASDMHNYGIYAHSLKSDARYLGFTHLAELAYNHEMAGKGNDITYVYNNYDVLIEEIKRVVEVVSKYMGINSEAVIKFQKKVASNKIVLVVDDSDIVTSFISKIFNNMYEVKTAKDGDEALNYIKNNFNDEIVGMLLDLNMPNVDGYQVLQYFQNNNLFDKVPVAIITGVEDRNDISKALRYPVIDVLSKPFNEKNIKAIIDKMEHKG